MLRYHMVVVTPDSALKRAVKRLTTATGATADFVSNESEIRTTREINLAIFDARDRSPSPQFLAQVPPQGRILYILRGENLARRVDLFKSPQACSLFCYDQQFDDDEFISSATKALRGDVFGLQKYFPWGVTTFTMLVKNHEEKNKAIEIMMQYAKMAGARGPVRDRVQLVADELMMNALYHAPVDEHGQELNRSRTQKELAQLDNLTPIEVQYGCSGRYFGISVRDGFGSLTRDRALSYLQRAGTADARIEDKKSGAGLGLISVLRSVSKLIFNLDPGYSTEVVGLFDMELFAKGMVGARSLHLFTAVIDDNDMPSGVGTDQTAALPESGGGGNKATWTLAFLLVAVTAALGTMYLLKQSDKGAVAADSAASITVQASPADAAITINGNNVASGSAWTVQDADSYVIEVSRQGFDTWSKTLKPSQVSGNGTLFVDLNPVQE